MRPIDEKIVSMKLDNRDFANKAAETTGIIGALTRTLNLIPGVNLGKTAQDIGEIRNQANSTNLSYLANSVGLISSRFSTLGIIAVTTLQNITNRAVDAGLALARSLTIDQVTSGFSEYELKMKSIKTILSNTKWEGTNLNDVKGALEELNEYADKTIYNFAEMTSSVGRFTTAGVRLKDSTLAIKGLSNLAADSGAGVEQLNTAMYQMSQMMAAGKMNLMDWNSLVNAGMAGKKTQDALLDTAKAMGINVDMSEGFRNSIGDGWITTEVFLETLKKFGNDQSMIEAATKVRTFSGMMDTLKESIGSGWATSFEHIFGDFEESTNLWSGLAERLTGSFAKISDSRNKFLSEAADMGAMQNIFEGIGNAVKPLRQLFQALQEGFYRVFPPVTVNRFVQLTEKFKEFTSGLMIGYFNTTKLATVFQGVFAAFSTVLEIGKRVGKMLIDLIPDGTGDRVLNLLVKLAEMSISFNKSVKEGNGLTAAIDGLGNGLRTVGGFVTDTAGSISNMVGAIKQKLAPALEFVMKLLKPVGQFLKDTFSGFGMQEVLGAATLTGGFVLFKKFGDILESVTGLFDTAKNGIGDLFNGLGDALSSFTQQVKYSNLLKIAISVGILAVSLKLLEGMETEDIVQGVAALASSLGILLGAMAIIEKFSITGGIKASITLIALATAVAIMAAALNKVAELDTDEMIRGVTGLVGVTATLTMAIVGISKLGGKVQAGSIQLIALATAVLIMSHALENLSSIDTGDLWKAIGALGVVFAQLAIFLKVVDGSKLGVGSAVGMTLVAAAIQIMVSAISRIAKIDTRSLVKGLVTITVILAQIALFSKLASGGSLIASGVGLLLISTALTMLLIPIKTLSTMSWEELIKGIGGIAVAMLAIAAASALMSGTILAGLGMMAVATGLSMLIIPIKAFSSMTWGEMLKGFAGLALGMAAVALSALLLTPAIVPMLGFGAALLLMGAAILAVGLGIGLFGAGLTALAALTATSVTAIVAALKMLMEGLGSLIVYIVDFVVDLGMALLGGIDRLAPKLIDTISNLIMELLETIVEKLPEFLRLGSEFIIGLINGIGAYVPKIVEAAINAIVNLVNGMSDALAEHGPRIVDAFLRLFGEVILLVIESGIKVIDALFGWLPGVEKATAKIGETAEEYIRENFGAREVGEEKGDEFVEGILTAEPAARDAGEKIGNAGTEGLNTADGKTSGLLLAKDFASGMNSGSGDVYAASWGLGMNAQGGIKDSLDINSPSNVTEEYGMFTGQGFVEGIDSTKPKVTKSAKAVADAAREQFQASKDWIDERKFYNKLTLQEELDAWKRIQSQYKKGSDERKEADREVYRLKNELVRSEFEHSKKWIDDRKYYNELSLTEELAAWERVQARYKAGTEERKEADREVYRLKNELVKAEMEHSKKWIDDRKYYNELSLTEELAAWERVQARYMAGTEERKEADREVYRLKNEINNRLIALNDEYTSKIEDANKKLREDELRLKEEYERSVKEVNDRLISEERRLTEEYDRAVADRTRSLVDFAGLFDEVPEKSDVSGQKLIDNLKGQVDTFSNWSDDIKKLSERGIDEGLLAELRDMGPKASGEIAALNSLTDDQLTEYSELWKAKNELARTEAVSELEGLRQDTYSKIAQLRAETAIQLETLRNDWFIKNEEIRAQASAQLDTLNTEWATKIEELSKGTKDEFVELSADMKDIGEDTIKGMMSGMESMQGPLVDKARSIAKSVASAIQSTLKIKSPSRVTRELGAFTGEGLAVGLASQVKNVANKSKDLALTAKESISKFLDGVGSGNNEIRISAVVDWNGIDPRNLRILPDPSLTAGMVRSVGAPYRQNGDNTLRDSNREPQVVTKEVKIDQHLTFNSRELTPSEVARKNLQASRQLAMQWEV